MASTTLPSAFASRDGEPLFPGGSAQVKLMLKERTDPDLVIFGQSHIRAMEGNPNFPAPYPPEETFEDTLAEFKSVVSGLALIRLQAQSMTERRDALREKFQRLFTLRGNYVQATSQGSADIIASAGLPIVNDPTTTKTMLPPLGFRLTRTQVTGELKARWNPVAKARSYQLEYAEVLANEPLQWQLAKIVSKATYTIPDLTLGHHYAFRVATIGGPDGISQWSPVVTAMAA